MRAAVLLVCGLSLVGCKKSAPGPGKSVPIESVCNEADGARVRMTGHLRYRRGLMSFCQSIGSKKTCDLALLATPDAPADFNVLRPRSGPEPVSAKLSVPVGDGAGEMADLPEKFSPSDVVLHLAGDGKATDGTRVTIDGKLSVIPGTSPKSCFVTVDWATPAEGRS